MKIFITGASGFIGGAIAKSLSQTHEVFALARSESSVKKVSALGAKPVSADLSSLTSYQLTGCEVFIHCAAYAEEWGTYDQFFEANVTGTEAVLTAARAAGVKRFIFIGTEAASFHGQDMLAIDETYPLAFNSPYSYSKTKALSEKLVLDANSADFQTIVIKPRMVWGQGDVSILPAVIAMAKSGKFSWINGGEFQTSSTHIDNLVHAVSLSLKSGAGGNSYFIANDEITTLKKFLTAYLETQGVLLGDNSVPKIIARLAAVTVDFLWKLLRLKRKPPIVRFSVDMMSANCTVRTDKAKRDLGYRPLISTADGLKQMPRAHGVHY